MKSYKDSVIKERNEYEVEPCDLKGPVIELSGNLTLFNSLTVSFYRGLSSIRKSCEVKYDIIKQMR